MEKIRKSHFVRLRKDRRFLTDQGLYIDDLIIDGGLDY